MIDVNDIANLGKLADGAKMNPSGGRPFIVLLDQQDNESIEYLEGEPSAPARAKGVFEVSTTDSFIALYKALAVVPVEGAPRVYMHLDPQATKPRIVAVLNDHSTKSAGHRDLRVNFPLPFSYEWQQWDRIDRKPQDQDAFASFLEDNMADVSTPPGVELLKLVLAFEETRTMVFKSAKRLQDGSQQITMGSNAEDSGSILKLPSVIRLSIPVFEGSAPQMIDARLKYRVESQKLKFTTEIELKHRIVKAAIDVAASKITSETGQRIIVGGP